DARGLHVDQKEADAVLLHLGVGAHEAEAPVGETAAGRPDLLTIDQIVVTLVLGLGLQAGQVGARARFRIALTPTDFSARDPGQMSFLLLVAAILEQGWTEQRSPHAGHGIEGAAVEIGLLDDTRFERRQATTADLLRPARCAPALVAHTLLPERPVRT